MSTAILVLSLLSISFNIVSGQDFSYKDPDSWVDTYPTCGGQRQSPINFNPLAFQYEPADCPVANFQSYDSHPDAINIKNNGHTVRVEGSWPTTPSISFNNELLEGSFRFYHFHIHWSEGNHNGSEHRVWGKGYTLEIHAVHLNNMYKTNDEALKAEDGVLVLGRVFEVVEKGAGDLDDLTEALAQVQEINSSADLPKYSLRKLGIDCPQQEFLLYEGSLTNPPCTENADHLLCAKPGFVSKKTVDALRKIKLNQGDTNNVRPTQATGERAEFYLYCKEEKQEEKKKD